MDHRFSAYGIGQRRQPNDTSSFAPIRSGGGGGGVGGIGGGCGPFDDNFRRSMNNIDNGYNNQRYADIDNNKFGGMQSNNYGRSGGDIGFSNFNNNHNNNSNNNQRFGNAGRGADHQTQSNFLGRTFDQRFNISGNDNNRNASNNGYMSSSDNYRGPQQQQQQQQQLPTNLGMSRSVSDLSYNNNNSNSSNINNTDNQRFYNNDRNIDTYRRGDHFNDNLRGQESSNLGRNGSNFKFNNERTTAPYNTGNFGNFNDRGINDDFRRPQSNDFPINNNNNSNNNQPFYNNNSQASIGAGNSNVQNYRGPNNARPAGEAYAVMETVNALMKNQSNWQVGNNNFGFGQGKPNVGGNRNSKWNFDNNSGPKLNANPNPMPVGNRPPQMLNQGRPPAARQIINNNSNKPQLPHAARRPPVVVNRPQNPQQKQIIKNPLNARNQPAVAQSVALNGGKPKPAQLPVKKNPIAAPAPNTQAKNKANISSSNNKPQEVKKEAPKTNAKVPGQKRVAEAVPVPLTKADIKRRKLAVKRGFLLGGFKLPYINNQKVALPQPEDKSYAIMFFEQAPNYSTSGEELDDEALAEMPSFEQEGKNAGRTLVKRIRKRLHYEWAIKEESKKYSSWTAWWTDYKWCEAAIKEQLQPFGSINLRNCFIPDFPRLTTDQVVDVIVSQGQFALEKNSDNYYNNMKSIFTLMNVTFLENLKMPNTEKVQDMIRGVPNDFWTYKMRSMVFLWAQYLKISKTSSPATETGVKELQAIARDWKNPVFHWIAKQAIDELKAISEVEWPEHKQKYASLESSAPPS
ncbi:putative uncharacterized protein DDB_G0286901 isoform X2 [Drosophila novamexicana]|uniref:putative uncharacterized protein DDB_G0286901 isoform X2 n=1 Tax=Drosophila novamexicana TaxID=47314 RepID=UPI0011E602EB|nr:putative uncharacterized protein DDB_G0286901 isoform X2 [Drosophila novamexicana]